MGCISMPTALLGSSLLGGAGSLISGGMQASAASSAAQQQQQAAQQAQQLVRHMFNTGTKMVMPFQQQGVAANAALSKLIGTNKGGDPMTAELTKKFQPTMEQLEETPGYKFTLQQGLDAAQNGYAAQGLGSSGAAMKGAINYAGGLASTTYQQQFQNYLQQNQQIYSMLANQGNMGLQAGLGVAGLASSAGNTMAGLLTSGAAAGAAGTMGAAGALGSGISGGLSSLGSGLSSYALLNGLQGGSGGIAGGLFGRKDSGNAVADAAQDREYY